VLRVPLHGDIASMGDGVAPVGSTDDGFVVAHGAAERTLSLVTAAGEVRWRGARPAGVGIAEATVAGDTVFVVDGAGHSSALSVVDGREKDVPDWFRADWHLMPNQSPSSMLRVFQEGSVTLVDTTTGQSRGAAGSSISPAIAGGRGSLQLDGVGDGQATDLWVDDGADLHGPVEVPSSAEAVAVCDTFVYVADAGTLSIHDSQHADDVLGAVTYRGELTRLEVGPGVVATVHRRGEDPGRRETLSLFPEAT
jgi:hypothetical protein